MTNTLILSRRIVAALVERGIEVPSEWCRYRMEQRGLFVESVKVPDFDAVPDLAQPENLHLLLKVADGLGGRPCGLWWVRESNQWASIAYLKSSHTKPQLAPTRSLAIIAAVCAALGIEVEA